MATAVAPAATTGNPDWDRLVGPADNWVREKLGRFESGKEITWQAVPGRFGNPPAFRLTLSSGEHSVSDELTADEITDRWEVRWKAGNLWGRLNDLQVQDEFREIHRLLAELQEDFANGG